jgi:hypothetical protein
MRKKSADRKVWEAAIMLIDKHGLDAVSVAQREAARPESDETTQAVWGWIARATAELLRYERERGETLH